MQIKVRTLMWIMILIPFLKPDCLSGSILSTLWNYMQYLSIICGIVFLISKARSFRYIKATAWCLALVYALQIVASFMNGLDIYLDFITCIKMFVLLACTSIFVYEAKWEFTTFIYRLFQIIIVLNFISVLLFYGKGMVQDSYDEAIYFWSTRNHIIGISLAALALGAILVHRKRVDKYKYRIFLIIGLLNIFMLKSTTAIIAILVFYVFLFIDRFNLYEGKIFNTKVIVICGVILQILVVGFQIQEQFGDLIFRFFGKDASFTGRTALWEQAIDVISAHWLWGLGNASAKGLSGWLTIARWDKAALVSKTTYYVAHNQFLEVFLNGGIFCFIAFVIALIFVVQSITKNSDKHVVHILTGTIFSYLVVMITEVLYPYPPVWIFLIVISYMPVMQAGGEEKRVEGIKNNSSDSSI